MKEREEVYPRAAREPGNMSVYREGGVYQKLHLCDYLRELPEFPVTEAEEAREQASLSPSRRLPVSR